MRHAVPHSLHGTAQRRLWGPPTRGLRSPLWGSLAPAYNPPPLSRLDCRCRRPAKVVTPISTLAVEYHSLRDYVLKLPLQIESQKTLCCCLKQEIITIALVFFRIICKIIHYRLQRRWSRLGQMTMFVFAISSK